MGKSTSKTFKGKKVNKESIKRSSKGHKAGFTPYFSQKTRKTKSIPIQKISSCHNIAICSSLTTLTFREANFGTSLLRMAWQYYQRCDEEECTNIKALDPIFHILVLFKSLGSRSLYAGKLVFSYREIVERFQDSGKFWQDSGKKTFFPPTFCNILCTNFDYFYIKCHTI